MPYVRTTIDIPEPLLRRAKAAASLVGKSLPSFVTEAIEQRLSHTTLGASGRRVSLPLVPSHAPGSIPITGQSLAQATAAEERAAGC